MWAVIALINASLASGIYLFGKYCLIGREEEFAAWRIPNKLEVVKKLKEEEKEEKYWAAIADANGNADIKKRKKRKSGNEMVLL